MSRAPLATLVCVAILLSPFIFRFYIVTGGSMEPVYTADTVVIVERLSHRLHVWRAEVLVIRNPHDHKVIEIKRVIGLPNETVELGESGVTVTDEKGRSTVFAEGTVIGGDANGTFKIKLGPEDYFVLGDNRSQSSDSRTFGAVQDVDIIGHVVIGR